MSIYGYARVSTKEQNLGRQLLVLQKYVPENKIIVDKQSGKDLDRPGYQALKGALGLRAGDTLYVKSLDRLSRNKQDIKNELQWFKDHGVCLKIIDLPTTLVDLGEGQDWIKDMVTNILIEVISSIAEQERLSIRQRQREGIDAAKKRGKHLGRPKLIIPEHFPEVYAEWKAGKYTARYAMSRLGMKSSSFYRAVKKYELKNQ